MLQFEHDFVRTARPLYAHLASLLETAIARGDLMAGARVPPERELAQRLRISRTTVVGAYRELEARGLSRIASACRPRACSCWPARSKGSICSRAA